MPRNRQQPKRFADGGDVGYGDLIQEDQTPLINEPTQTMSMADGGSVYDYIKQAGINNLKGGGNDYNAIVPQESTLRERASDTIQDYLSKAFGNYKARKIADTIVGGEQSNLPLGLGVASITPAEIPFAVQEGSKDIKSGVKNIKQGDVASGAIDIGSGALNVASAYPAVKIASKGAQKLSDKAIQLISRNPNATGAQVIDYASQFSPSKIDIGPRAKTWNKNSADIFQNKYNEYRSKGMTHDQANRSAWKDSQVEGNLGEAGTLGTRFLPGHGLAQEVTDRGFSTEMRPYKGKDLYNLFNSESQRLFGKDWRDLSPDLRDTIRNQEIDYRRVKNVSPHPELLKAYPDIGEYPADIRRSKVISGGFAPISKAYSISGPSKEARTSGALHELGHAVQHIEDWPTGSSPSLYETPEYSKKLKNLQNEYETMEYAYDTKKRADRMNMSVEDMLKQQDADIAHLTGGASPNLSPRIQEMMSRGDLLAKTQPREELHQEFARLSSEMDRSPLSPLQAYRQTMGEAHARAIENRRRDLSDEMRKNRFPEDSYDFDTPVNKLRYDENLLDSPVGYKFPEGMANGGRVNLADGTDPSMREVLRNFKNSFTNPQHWAELGAGAKRAISAMPSVIESGVRGSIAQAPGTLGDLNKAYLDLGGKPLFPNAPKAPTTREILDYVPRLTPTHEGAETIEDVFSVVGAPLLGSSAKLVGDTSKLLGKEALEQLGPKAYQMAEDYMRKTGMLNDLFRPASSASSQKYLAVKAEALAQGAPESVAREVASKLTKEIDSAGNVTKTGVTEVGGQLMEHIPDPRIKVPLGKTLTIDEINPELVKLNPELSGMKVTGEGYIPNRAFVGEYIPSENRAVVSQGGWTEKFAELYPDTPLIQATQEQIQTAKELSLVESAMHESQHGLLKNLGYGLEDVGSSVSKEARALGFDPKNLSYDEYKLANEMYKANFGETLARANAKLATSTPEELATTPLTKYFDLPAESVSKAKSSPIDYGALPTTRPVAPEVPAVVPDIVTPTVPVTEVAPTFTEIAQNVASNPYAKLAVGTGAGAGAVNLYAEEAPQVQEPVSTPSDDFWTKFFNSYNSYQEPSYESGSDYGYSPIDYEMYNFDVPSQPEYTDYTGGYTEFDYKRGGRVHDDIPRMRAELLRKKK